MGNPFKTADPYTEAVHAVITTTVLTGGRVVSEVEWCIAEGSAEEVAEYAVTDAMEGEYAVQVFVVKLVKKCFVDDKGKIDG